MTERAKAPARAVSTEPFRMSARELLRLYRTRELSPVEAMASVIGRVEVYEPHIHATFLYAPERALSEARASEARWAKAEPIGPLDGVPVTVKDNIATRGDPKPVGTAAEPLTPQKADAPPAARLREAGAIIFTKTTMPDYGMLSSGLSSFHALARNPWKLDRNPGGSSSGAGAAAAALYGPLHLGTDIGGSVQASGWMVRNFRPEAERRTDPDRSALYGAGRRADDAGRGGRRADDGDAVAARRARLCEPRIREARLGDRARLAQGPAHWPARGRRLRSAADAGSARGDRARGAGTSRPRARMSSRSSRSSPRRCSTASTVSGARGRSTTSAR